MKREANGNREKEMHTLLVEIQNSFVSCLSESNIDFLFPQNFSPEATAQQVKS